LIVCDDDALSGVLEALVPGLREGWDINTVEYPWVHVVSVVTGLSGSISHG